MIKKFFYILICFFMFFTFLNSAHQLIAATPTELQQKIQDTQKQRDILLDEQKKLQAELDALGKQGNTLQSAVKSLDATRLKLVNDIKITQSKINSANLNIQSLENSIVEKESKISIHQKAIRISLRELYDYDSHSMIVDLLNNKSFNEVWADQGMLSGLNDRLGNEIENLHDAKQNLTKEKEKKEKIKTDLIGFKTELGGQKSVVEENKTNKAKLLLQTKNQETAYQKLLADNIAREKQFEADLFMFESQLKFALDPSLIPAPAPSILSWPIDKVRITQQFGKTSSSGRLYASGTHNGTDFGASVGTPIKSVREGVVSGIGNTDDQRGCYSYGRWVLIKHDNGLSTLYAHLSSSIVSIDQTVSRGQVIGYSGGMPGANGSGFSTGPHLHLGLYATQGIRIEQYTSSINCKGVKIPLADPRAYLNPLAYLPSL